MKRSGIIVLMFIVICGCQPDFDIFGALFSTPSKVDLVFPENNSECTAGVIISETESEVIFDWTDAQVGDLYEISLTNLTTGQERLFESDSSSLPIRLFRGTPYQWRVSTILTNSQQSTSSDTEVFYNAGPGVQSFIPFPAIAITPLIGQVLDSNITTITLEWEASDLDGDITEFDVYFGTESIPPLLAEGLTTNSLTDVLVNSGEVYNWRIITRDAQGNESQSEIFTFEVSPN